MHNLMRVWIDFYALCSLNYYYGYHNTKHTYLCMCNHGKKSWEILIVWSRSSSKFENVLFSNRKPFLPSAVSSLASLVSWLPAWHFDQMVFSRDEKFVNSRQTKIFLEKHQTISSNSIYDGFIFTLQNFFLNKFSIFDQLFWKCSN